MSWSTKKKIAIKVELHSFLLYFYLSRIIEEILYDNEQTIFHPRFDEKRLFYMQLSDKEMKTDKKILFFIAHDTGNAFALPMPNFFSTDWRENSLIKAKLHTLSSIKITKLLLRRGEIAMTHLQRNEFTLTQRITHLQNYEKFHVLMTL